MVRDKSNTNKFLLFICSPIIGLISSLKTLDTKSSRRILFFFIVFFGFSMIYDGSFRNDGLFHAYEFQNFHKETFESYYKMLVSFFDFNNPENTKDIYNITIEYVVSRFTSNYHYYFGILSLLFAFFTVKFFKYFGDEAKFTWSIPWVVLLYIFWTPEPYAINGVRFCTASVILIYSLFKVFVDNENKFLICIAVTPLIHAAFIFACAVVAIIYLTRRFEKIWIVLFFLSFIYSEFSMQLLKDNVGLIQSQFWAEWTNSYINYEDTYAIQGSGFYWITPVFEMLSRMFMLGMIIIIIMNKQIIKDDSRTNNLFMVIIIWYTISNFALSIPSLGLRFIRLTYPFIGFIWARYFMDTKYVKYLYLYPICNLLALKNTWDIYSSLLEPSFLVCPLYNLVKYTIDFVPVIIPATF